MCTRVVKYWYNTNRFFYKTVITRDSVAYARFPLFRSHSTFCCGGGGRIAMSHPVNFQRLFSNLHYLGLQAFFVLLTEKMT